MYSLSSLTKSVPIREDLLLSLVTWHCASMLQVSLLPSTCPRLNFATLCVNRDWLGYIVPLVLLSMASYMLWLRHSGRGDDFNEVVVPTPPAQNTVEQLLALQQALSQLEGLLQSGNIMLLKLRALFFSVLPQVLHPFMLLAGSG